MDSLEYLKYKLIQLNGTIMPDTSLLDNKELIEAFSNLNDVSDIEEFLDRLNTEITNIINKESR